MENWNLERWYALHTLYLDLGIRCFLKKHKRNQGTEKETEIIVGIQIKWNVVIIFNLIARHDRPL
jgi:hypothetical protein